MASLFSESRLTRNFTSNRGLLSFYLLALLIVLGVMATSFVFHTEAVLGELRAFLVANHRYPNLWNILRFAARQPWAWLIVIFASAPSISAILVSACTGGTAAVRRLFARFIPWQAPVKPREAFKAYAVLGGTSAIVTVCYLIVGSRYGAPTSWVVARTALGGAPLAMLGALLVGPFIDEGGTLEELGWRGFALPELSRWVRSPLVATVLLATLWWGWHLPRELPSLLASGLTRSFLWDQGYFLLTCLSLSLIISYFWFWTGGSVWPAIFVHGVTNLWSKALGEPVNNLAGTDVRNLLVIGVAGAIVIFAGPGLGRRAEM